MEENVRIPWQDWEPEVFSRARTQGKLVFLDISATWCHWCHVLDRTSLSDPRVVRLLNDDFIPVRVDTDRRPDINERYNQGGWPTTAVLLPNGQLLTGATYLTPDALFEVLAKCADFYRRDRMRIDQYLQENASHGLAETAGEGPAPRSPMPEDLALVRHAVLARYDPVHPGFFREPKFLVTDILAFLRDAWFLEGRVDVGETFQRVLRTMGSSGVIDPVEGGFFRYATRRDWTVPHYEKLLIDNAEMLSLYASAYGKTGDQVFARSAEMILRFLLTRLYDPGSGAFFSSQDADQEYFTLDAEGRSKRIPPAIDRTIISEYNGSAVSALVMAHRSFGGGGGSAAAEGGTLLERAERLAGYLRGSLWSRDEGQIRFRDGKSSESGHLSDNVSMATACLDLWEACGKKEYLEWAGDVLDGSVRQFFSPKSHGFLDRRARGGEAGPLNLSLVPFPANARMACALLRYSREAARPDLFAVAEMTLSGLSAEFENRAAFAAPYGSALLLYRKGSEGSACIPGDPSCTPPADPIPSPEG